MTSLSRKIRSGLFLSSTLGHLLQQLSQRLLRQLLQKLWSAFVGVVFLSLPAFGNMVPLWVGAEGLSFSSKPDYGSRFDLTVFSSALPGPDKYQLVPQVHLPAEKQWEQLNHYTWEAFFNNVQPASEKPESKAFVSPRVSASFSRNEFFWDQAFISLGFGLYAHQTFSSLGGLNCFYKQQHPDGFIPREIAPDGSEVRFFPGTSIFINDSDSYAWVEELKVKVRNDYCEDNNSNPPLAAHAEWRHFLLSRNKARLSAVYNVLAAHTEWLEKNRKIEGGDLAGLFTQGNMGSGMDNLPSSFKLQGQEVKENIWDYYPHGRSVMGMDLKQELAQFDISAQMKLHYDAMASISKEINKKEEQQSYQSKAKELKDRINKCLWNKEVGFYFNAFKNCNNKSQEYTLSAYWGLYAEIADHKQAKKMLKYLKDKKYFNTPMPFPALARSDKNFYESGDYWRGGVWPPLVYMTLKGLMKYAEPVPEAWSIAVRTSESYLKGLAKTMIGADKEKGDLETCWKNPDDGVHSCASPGVEKRIYEYNSPTTGGPGLRKDATGKAAEARDNFVGWGGLGPIGVMQEVAVGLDVRKDELVWYLNRTDEHGVKQLFIGSQSLDITVAGRAGEPLSRDHISVAGVLPKDSPVRRLRVVPKDNPENTIIINLTAE